MKKLIAFALGISFLTPFFLHGENLKTITDERREALKKQLEAVQGEIQSYRGVVEEKQDRAATLEDELKRLNRSIGKEEEAIQLRTQNIGALSQEIRSREAEIRRLEQLSEKRRQDLAHALQFLVEEDSFNLLEMLLEGVTLTASVARVERLSDLQKGIGLEIEELEVLARTIAERVTFLQDKREEEKSLRRVQELARKELERNRKEQNQILTKTRGEERRYQELLSKSQSTAEAIRQQLYILEGVGVALKFEEALRLAEYVSGLTGVRPAYLLAVLQKESKWGERQGTGTWREDMHRRDHEAFLAITKELGLDPDKMPVSKKPWYGWGGAMGPAQFLPSIWLIYKDQIATLTGHNPPNPWNINDAFVAAGLKLARAGADEKTPDKEWRAAMVYFAGKNWQNPAYSFYGDAVMELAKTLQEQIDILKKA